jgi:hypothetical protein
MVERYWRNEITLFVDFPISSNILFVSALLLFHGIALISSDGDNICALPSSVYVSNLFINGDGLS